MAGFAALSVVISLLALVGTSPFWMRVLLYYFHQPNIHIFFAGEREREAEDDEWVDLDELSQEKEIKWSQITGDGSNTLNIRNREPREYTIDIEFTTEKPWDVRPGSESLIDERGLGGGYPYDGGFWYKIRNPMNNGQLSPGSGGPGFKFPFEKPREAEAMNGSVTITVYPEVELSEFGPAPKFFGSIQLQPIERTFHFEP